MIYEIYLERNKENIRKIREIYIYIRFGKLPGKKINLNIILESCSRINIILNIIFNKYIYIYIIIIFYNNIFKIH